jgi:nucleoside-diphosphate-sugar epimerase
MKKRTVVVFGGGGYVGSALVPMLLTKDFKVKVFDTFWYGISVFA